MSDSTTNGDGLWTHTGSKFVIGTLHGELIEIEAQYNPKEVARNSAATWNGLEYGTTEPRTLTVELTFDGYEMGVPIAPIVDSLESLTIPVDTSSSRISERRPQICVAVWGSQRLQCVVTSVATKLTMFDTSGAPVRAICTVALKELDAVAMMNADNDRSDLTQRDARTSSRTTK